MDLDKTGKAEEMKICHLAKRAFGVAVWILWRCDDRHGLLMPLLRMLRLAQGASHRQLSMNSEC